MAAIDPDLQAVIERWPELPEVVRAGIVAMVRAVGTGASQSGVSTAPMIPANPGPDEAAKDPAHLSGGTGPFGRRAADPD